MKQQSKNRIIKYIWSALKPFRWFILAEILVCSVWAADLSVIPYLLKTIVNKVETIKPTELLPHVATPAIIYVLMSVVVIGMFRFIDWIRLTYLPKLRKTISCSLMEHLMGHSHTFYQSQFAGNLANKVQNVSEGVATIVEDFFSDFVSRAFAIAFAIYTMSTVDSKFALALTAWVGLFIGIAMLTGKKMQRLSSKYSSVRSRNMGLFVDILSNMSALRLFAGRKNERKNVSKAMDQFATASRNRDWFFFKTYAVQGISFVLFESLCMWWLVRGAINGTVTPGDFALVLSLSMAIVDMLWQFSNDFSDFTEYLGNVDEGLNLTTQLHEISDKPDAKALVVSQGKITFDNVNFHYKDATPLFSGKSINILPGQKVGLVGYSGSGKTTFVNLILRLFDIRSGKITIDDQNIQDVTQDSLRQSIAMIPQDPSLFHRSIAENIAYGMENVTQEQIIQAADNAHAHEFITRLPEQYEAMVGERGVKLSGGQRQRIAIARAFLKNSPILILDEATSQLDSVTEQLIQESLWKLMQGKTTLVIAHRLSTLLHMDRILVFEKGKIVQDGTHAELLTQKGLYKTLWSAQIGGFLDDQANLA